MKAPVFVTLFIGVGLIAAGSCLHAQGKGPGPGGPPPAGPPPSAQSPSGGPGNHGGPPPPPSSSAKSSNASASTGSGVQFGPVSRWWDDTAVARTVGLTTQQKKQMDSIFDADKPAILNAYREFLKQQAALKTISKDPNASQTQTFAAIDAVNQARAALEKSVAQMYLQLRQQMTPDQVEKVEKLQ
jgi:Spy/CpxP family protein refolding chaperone